MKKYYITNQDFYNLLKTNQEIIIIDVRSKVEHKILPKIKNDINIDINYLMNNYKTELPDKDSFIITYCNAGNRSSTAAVFLKSLGYKNTYVLKSGIYDFQKWLNKNNLSI